MKKKWPLILLVFFLPLACELFFLSIENPMVCESLWHFNIDSSIFKTINPLRLVFLSVFVLIVIGGLQYFGWKKLSQFLFKYRYLIALVTLTIALIFEIHGSSTLCWQNYLADTQTSYQALIGRARLIRSDEWAVNTPMMISQYLNHSGIFPYFSETIRGALTDTFIVYGQPVLDMAVIFRPFHWGYLLLSAAKGLSFFWMSRLIILFLVSFEFGRILTKDKRILALSYAILLTFAPIVQWWFAINGLVEMLIFGQLGVVLINTYMKTQDYRLRTIIGLALAVIAGGYILTFYPAWQVVLVYVFLVLLIAVVLENVRNFKWNRKDLLILTGALLFLGLGLFYVLSQSAGTIDAVMNTVYPGNSEETGGGQFTRFFLSLGNLFFPLATDVPYANVCELSVFFDFFPMGILMALWVGIKEKKKDPFLIGMLILNGILILWCIFSWPLWFAKLSLLSFSKPVRAFLAVGFLNLLLLFRAMAIVKTSPPKWVKAIIALGLASLMTGGAILVYEGYLDLKLGVISFVLMVVSFLILINGNRDWAKKALLILSLFIAFIGGAFVNPLVSGLDIIEEQKIIHEIKAITADDNGLWIYESGEDTGFPVNNLPLLGGAPTINSTNVYPNLERWRQLDPDGSDEDIYNRYAHISMNLSDEKNKESFVLESPDLFRVNLKIADLKTLEIDYILTKRNLSEFSGDDVSLEELAHENGFRIYGIDY